MLQKIVGTAAVGKTGSSRWKNWQQTDFGILTHQISTEKLVSFSYGMFRV